ncbi:Lactosylceramide 4-alpha-galactosyltransferase [Thalictrum thalictroides]|uniref:Lactosylceramide 4-alpha-galactosyltransferase n=1 Tax=Thalictrum thalictroides TaxID=46969 RepID=A0A7J6XBU5_THATH|nr:Lactosylceramide 4-alpha-galactosyltransferase [Thalictrum thalictroides]
MYAVNEKIPVSKLNIHVSLLQKTEIFNTSLSLKPKKLSKIKPYFKILKSTVLSKNFSVRIKEFFNGSGSNSSCKLRFFMTWISSLESFGYREFFSIESVFKSHPDACLLILSSSMDTQRGNQLLRPFKEQGFRVSAISPDLEYIFKNTSAEAWFDKLKNGNVDPGEVPLGQNLSNLLRLVILYKYGGIYLDTDVIVLKRFDGLRNVIGAQTMDLQTGNWSRLNNAAMIFDKKHPLLSKFIREFARTFNGNKWGHNGPYLVSRVVSRVSNRPGFNFTVMPPLAFYPVDWNKVHSLFDGPINAAHSKWMSAKLRQIRENSFGVHLWNKQSRQRKVEKGSILNRIMLDCCVFCDFSVSAF